MGIANTSFRACTQKPFPRLLNVSVIVAGAIGHHFPVLEVAPFGDFDALLRTFVRLCSHFFNSHRNGVIGALLEFGFLVERMLAKLLVKLHHFQLTLVRFPFPFGFVGFVSRHVLLPVIVGDDANKENLVFLPSHRM